MVDGREQVLGGACLEMADVHGERKEVAASGMKAIVGEKERGK